HLENQVEEFIRNGRSTDVMQEELTGKERLKYAWGQVASTAKKVAPYVFLGVGIGALIHNWIPEEMIIKVLGTGNPFGVMIATIAGVPMYADIFGCIPIAEALLAKGARLGVVLSFMMGVTTLSLPSMIMLKKAVKPKLLGIFIAICTVGIILVGYFFNAVQYMLV
ncbi:MAG: permease, partial [Clostridiales bacterium]|nr:permease [Clostridiales bacterium]